MQECPDIVTFIKHLVQKRTYRFALTDLYLGLRLDAIGSVLPALSRKCRCILPISGILLGQRP